MELTESKAIESSPTEEAGGGRGRGEISTHILTHYSEIVKSLNYEELMGYLRQEDLLNEEQLERLTGSSLTPREKRSMILDTIIAGGQGACGRFLSCIQTEVLHLGHVYIASLLEGKVFSTDKKALRFSLETKGRVKKHHTHLKDIDFSALVPVMLKYDLLTSTESQLLLSDKEAQSWKVARLEVILSTKGPLAHDIFVRCLGEEETHPTHGELHSLLISPTFTNSDGFDVETDSAMNKELQRVPRKRKIESNSTRAVTLSKRQPREFELEGPLAGKRYSELMLTFQTCHHSGEWCKLEVEVQNVLSCGIPELGAVALLEEAISHIFRQNREKVLDCVGRARQLIRESSKIQQSGGNTRILQARCEHIVSCLYRYAKKYREAFRHATNALAHLVQCDSAEDKSFAFYCSACIRLESYTDPEGLAVDEAGPEQIKQDFRLAIEFARSHNIGMDVVKPHSHIRLAQQCLGSTQFTAGCVTKDSLRFREAENSLSEVNAEMLSQRSKSLFYLLKSDLCMNKGNTDEAIVLATESLELSKASNFAVEQHSAEARLQSLRSGL